MISRQWEASRRSIFLKEITRLASPRHLTGVSVQGAGHLGMLPLILRRVGCSPSSFRVNHCRGLSSLPVLGLADLRIIPKLLASLCIFFTLVACSCRLAQSERFESCLYEVDVALYLFFKSLIYSFTS